MPKWEPVQWDPLPTLEEGTVCHQFGRQDQYPLRLKRRSWVDLEMESRANSQISAKVWMHIWRKGSSACSATAMNALMIGSDRGTEAVVLPAVASRRTVPTSTMVRMNLITCSFSTANLLSRVRDLRLWVTKGAKDQDTRIPNDVPLQILLLDYLDGMGIHHCVSDKTICCSSTLL